MALRVETLRKRLNDKMTFLKDRLPQDLPPVKVAKYIVEGAIVGFDTNETTKGVGARFLGIGGDKKYRHDVVTIALRLVDVRNGDVVSSASSTKHVYSLLLHGGVYQYVAVDKILEIEAGVSRNEPATLAVRHAVEHALYSIIVEGVGLGIWSFADDSAGAAYIEQWRRRNNPKVASAVRTE